MKNKVLWITGFLFIILLTQANLFIDFADAPSFLGFPDWLWWFVGVHVLLIGVLYLFMKKS